ncbi:hypothetical protein CI109_102631 [Kwoniella shandongensis]|uniref:Uncharacterized protein n=1 Tax=Kwoniella shandongensis TaxID=1734106 RepID=A0A5M6BUM6_9TREE|nr:uncharacterized protein CI109_005212 [Kwoniella shandongensis]KAA5526443.1 hypothetical protein CI109_005212 [Kwoniella shandongensis]
MVLTGKELTEEEVETTLNKLKAADTDRKVDIVQFFGLRLEEVEELPESAIDAITLILPPLVRNPHPLLHSSTLTALLPFFIPHLPLSPPSHLRLALLQVLPAIVERLNDAKDRIHDAASTNVFLLGKLAYQAESSASAPSSSSTSTQASASSSSSGPSLGLGQSTNGNNNKGKEKETLSGLWERYLKDVMAGKGWRGKVEAMKVLIRIRGEVGSKMGLKSWLGVLVDLLEDGDGNVRDQARETVVALLSPSSTPPAARSELKKLLVARNVRKTIADNIITRVLGGGASSGTASGRSTPGLLPNSGTETPAEDVAKSGAVTPALTAGGDEIEIVYIASPHDLANEFASMLPHFQGKETEQNWLPREKSTVRIRGMLRGQAHAKYTDAFVAGLKNGMTEGISKTIMSLRTTVAQQSCMLLRELAENLGSNFDQFVDFFLPILGKMSGFTKKIIADRSQNALTAIIIHTTGHPRLFITHVATGVGEKNVQTRHFCAGHVKTFIDIHGTKARHQIETTAGLLDQLEGAIKKSLADVNPSVRELARQAFWSYHLVWPQRAGLILNGLDGMARKQLEKANPREPSDEVLTAVPIKAAPPARRATSTMSALLAERRKAKAAELAAGKMGQESPRIVSNPVPNSPSIQQGLPRSSSSTSLTGASSTQAQPARLSRSITSPETSTQDLPDTQSSLAPSTPTPQKTAMRPVGKPQLGSPQDLRARTSSFGRSSPPAASRGSPSNRDSPLRQSSTFAPTSSGLRSPPSASSSAGSSKEALKTPQPQRRSLASFTDDRRSPAPVGLGVQEHDTALLNNEWNGDNTPSRTPASDVVDDARHAQVAQAESAAKQLLEYAEEENSTKASPITRNRLQKTDDSTTPVTPARTHNGNGHSYKTPLNSLGGRKAWEDSPRPEAITPLMLEKLRNRRHERVFWRRREELLEKASPLKSSSPTPASAIIADIEALESGEPQLRNLQKIALFSAAHPITSVDEEEMEGEKKIWLEGNMFDRVVNGLWAILSPDKERLLLEQGLVVLWELVQYQWTLFDGQEQTLCDALFRLRASHDVYVLESTNALISLLVRVSEPIYFLAILRTSFQTFLQQHPTSSSSSNTGNGVASTSNDLSQLSLSGDREPDQRVRNSGYLFGLTSMGLCVLRLPAAVIEAEGPKLGEVIQSAINEPSSIIRQAGYSLLLSIQTVLQNSTKTLSFVSSFVRGQKDLAVYYMAQNGILESTTGGSGGGSTSTPSKNGTAIVNSLHNDAGDGNGDGDGDEKEEEEDEQRREKMSGELEGLMARGVARE